MSRLLSNGLLLGIASGAPAILTGTGTPEAAVTANPGSLYLDKNGGLWVKARGTGNTGWAPDENAGGNINSTNWFWTPQTGVSTRLFTANGECLYQPILFSWPVTLDALGFEVSTAGAAGALVRVGLFAMADTGLPGTVLKDCGTVATMSTGGKATSTGQNIQCKPGWYWVALAAQGAPATQTTIRVCTTGMPQVYLNSGSATVGSGAGANQAISSTGITGAFADNPAVTVGNVNPPRIMFKPLSVP